MAKGSNQKLKLLYLEKILFEKTDDEHMMSVKEIISELEKLDISAERKSIYDDIRLLNDYGLSIESTRSKTTGYYVGDRKFQLAELKLLVDAVQCSRFFTPKKSKELIQKISTLASSYQAKGLMKQSVLNNSMKTVNELIYYNVDKIYNAIEHNRQIKFKYFDYTIKNDRRYRKDGEQYTASPLNMAWDSENYYLIAFHEGHNNLTHYRVDRMAEIDVTDKPRCKPPNALKTDFAEYYRKTFNMFGGEEHTVRLRFHNSLINQVFDRFGRNCDPEECGGDYCVISASVAVSPPFFGWLAQFRDKMEILSPQAVIDEYKAMMKDILRLY